MTRSMPPAGRWWSAMPPACGRPAPSSVPPLRSTPSAGPAEARFEAGTVDVVDLGLVPADLPFGRISAVAGEAAYRSIERACQLVVDGGADAICTAPISKEALHAAGHRYPGHTELLAHLTGTPEVSMMLTAPKLRVIHVTTHMGLLDAIQHINPGLVERTIQRGHDTLVKAGIADPRIGVCAINPHAGEHGLFGRGEEAAKIEPAVAAARRRAGGSRGRCRPIPCSFARRAAISIWWWPCITTRDTGRSRSSASRRG